MNLSIAFITSRYEPRFQWFLESLKPQIRSGDDIEILWCDLHFTGEGTGTNPEYKHFAPKPCVWSGAWKLTKDHWWSKASSLNSAICHAAHQRVAFVDDRCILGDHWLQSVREADDKGRIVVGSYAKFHGMKVGGGKILEQGKPDGADGRRYPRDHQIKCDPGAFFGCCWTAPLPYILEMNGVDERSHALGFEDVLTGMLFANNGHSIYYDGRFFVSQDRTPEECGPTMKRTSKERHPHDESDKTWTALKTWAKEKRSNPDFDLAELREKIQRGEPFPHHNNLPAADWYDGMKIPEGFDAL